MIFIRIYLNPIHYRRVKLILSCRYVSKNELSKLVKKKLEMLTSLGHKNTFTAQNFAFSARW